MTLTAKTRRNLKIIALLSIVAFVAFSVWLLQLNSEMKERIAKGWFLPPTQIFAAPLKLSVGQRVNPDQLKNYLIQFGYRQRGEQQKLFANDFGVVNKQLCQMLVSEELPAESVRCISIRFDQDNSMRLALVVFSQTNEVLSLYGHEPLRTVTEVSFEPEIFAQFYGKKPMLRKVISLSDVPLYCSQAVTAIEDKDFLQHSGFSVTGILRAFYSNLITRRNRSGGSTITQQLIKNYFLTPERKLSRKFKEIIMSVLLELQVSKDVILQSYLNVIYMGQNGPFEVRGFHAAAQHYFYKNLSSLNLSECALLAAVLNSPGRYNPFTQPENALKRRKRVLDKMLENNMINQSLYEQANNNPLPTKRPKALSEPAPYFVDAIFKKLDELGVDRENGLKIYTSLNISAQESAQWSVASGLKKLETDYKSLKDKKEKDNKNLEAMLVSIDLKTGGVIALVGGRSYRFTQYNRAVDSHRQVGSVMKPFVYLAALENFDSDGNAYTPLTQVEDAPWTYEYDGQSWSPRNYSKEFVGKIPMYYALKQSINVPTAKIGVQVGLNSVIDVARRLGVESSIEAFPSLTLGAFELYPLEVAKAYTAIARMGEAIDLELIRQVTTANDKVLFENQYKPEQVIAAETAAVLVGMLKQTVVSGTARSLSWRGFSHTAAGKTGTTSDTKDSWFVGFTPHILTLVWVGYDDNTAHGLTGATGALPIWADYMKNYGQSFKDEDFTWPPGTATYTLSPRQVLELIPEPNESEQQGVELIFRSQNTPN